jgi:D(-)-tartrate dehydratase
MRVVAVNEAAVPVRSAMRNAVFSFADMTTSVVAIVTDVIRDGKPVVGYAFNSTGRYACGAQMRARFIPRLLSAAPEALLDDAGTNFDPAKALAVMLAGEKPGGHSDRSIAIGTIEVALWDAVAKVEGLPLYRSLAQRYSGGVARERMFVYVGGGWYRPGGTLDDLRAEVGRHLDAGYRMVKIKVGGLPLAEDVKRVEAALAVVGSPDRLAVDANARFARDEALAYADALAPLKLRWFEEPTDPHDYALMAELAARYAPPLATGENLYSTQDVVNLARFGGWRAGRDVIQVDPPQAYGLAQYARTLAALEPLGFRRTAFWPHGGNQMSLHVAAGFGLGGCESYPGVFGAFGGFADDARIEDGMLGLPDRPGIGFEAQGALFELMRGVAQLQ